MAAKRLASRFRKRAKALSVHPFLGRQVPEFTRRDYREIVESGYRIIYTVDDAAVTILRVWYSRRDLSRGNRF